MDQLEVEADFYGLVGLLEMIGQLKSPDDDGSREIILVITSKGSVSGPIMRLRTDGLKSTKYLFVGLHGFKNAMRASFPAISEPDYNLSNMIRLKYGEKNDWHWKDKGRCTYDVNTEGGGGYSKRRL